MYTRFTTAEKHKIILSEHLLSTQINYVKDYTSASKHSQQKIHKYLISIIQHVEKYLFLYYSNMF